MQSMVIYIFKDCIQSKQGNPTHNDTAHIATIMIVTPAVQ